MTNDHVCIIILNWNGWRDTLECMDSLFQTKYPNYDLIVLDNGSKDESIEKIIDYFCTEIEAKPISSINCGTNKTLKIIKYAEGVFKNLGNNYSNISGEISFDERRSTNISSDERRSSDMPFNGEIILIQNDENYGFAEGNNIGIRYALEFLSPNYILLLNNDTTVDGHFLSELVYASKRDASIGFAGPKIYYYDYQGRKDVINVAGIELSMRTASYYRIGANEVDQGQLNEMRQVDYLEGSCLLIKREVLDKIGLLNSDYFAYWEEADLCLRGAKTGYKSVYVPGSRIWHKVSSSSVGSTKLYYMTRNRLLFIRDNAPKGDLLYFLLYFFAYRFWLDAGVYLRRRDLPSLKAFVKGVRDGIIEFYNH